MCLHRNLFLLNRDILVFAIRRIFPSVISMYKDNRRTRRFFKRKSVSVLNHENAPKLRIFRASISTPYSLEVVLKRGKWETQIVELKWHGFELFIGANNYFLKSYP